MSVTRLENFVPDLEIFTVMLHNVTNNNNNNNNNLPYLYRIAFSVKIILLSLKVLFLFLFLSIRFYYAKKNSNPGEFESLDYKKDFSSAGPILPPLS